MSSMLSTRSASFPTCLSQASAASRLASGEDAVIARGGRYDSDKELNDNPGLLSSTEDVDGVRDLAVNGWARIRILDGCWYSPARHY
jgi:hypothetical protein